MNALDLTQRPPRSPRVRLGDYVMLARVIDKARASLSGKAGDYKFGNPMDQHFFAFTGIGPDALQEQVKTGVGDWAMRQWVDANALRHSPETASPCALSMSGMTTLASGGAATETKTGSSTSVAT